MELIPILFLGMVFLFSFATSKTLRKRLEEQRRHEAEVLRAQNQSQPAQQNPVQRPAQPVRTVASEKPVTPTQPKAAVCVQPTQTVKPTMTKPAPEQKNMQQRPVQNAEPEKAESGSLLNWNENSALQGIIYAEILGKPKALRH